MQSFLYFFVLLQSGNYTIYPSKTSRNNTMTIKIHDNDLRNAAQEGIDAFLELIILRTKEAAGGELNADNMQKLSSQQITLLGYAALREELMDGGFIQLIYNGWGPFFFNNPFDFAIKQWGAVDLCRLMRRVKKVYQKRHEEIEHEMNDEEFMALYEKMPEFDDFDDEFVSNEEQWTETIAQYVDGHLLEFIEIETSQE